MATPDINWPIEDADGSEYAIFAATVAQTLRQKDYCITQLPLSSEISAKALAEASSGDISYQSLRKELQTTFLGRDARAKVHWMQGEDGAQPETALDQLDFYFTTLGQLLEPLTPAAFDFESSTRTGSMIRRPYASTVEEAELRQLPIDEDDVEDGLVDSHIMFCRRRKLCMMFVVESEGGNLTLFPEDAEKDSISVPLTHGQLVIFRHDRLSYSYEPKSSDDLVLLSWLLAKAPGLAPGAILGTGGAKDALIGLVKGPGTPLGHQINVVVIEPGLPSGAHSEESRYWAAMAGGCDGYVKVPKERFDIDPYFIDYTSGKWEIGYAYACHGGFCTEDIYALDNDFFNISEDEAYIMSPDTKMILQHGYSCLYKAGNDRKSITKKHCGLYAAHSGNDWSSQLFFTHGEHDVYRNGYANRSWHNQFARVQYELGMRGQVMSVDTACSSALVCYANAHTSMRRSETYQEQSAISCNLKEAMVISANMIPGPGSFVALSGPHMLSVKGRCFTFDGSADGFARAEGTGCFYVQLQETFNEDCVACMIGSCTNQDGRSASMTAPNGPAQQECIRGSMKEAGCDANDVTCAECHGTGTALGDPIEVGALKGVMKNRVVPLIESSAKAHIGHAECTAGMAGVMKCLVMCSAAAGSPSPHLFSLNPHLDITGYPTLFCTELVNYEANASITGVSSFGWGGANGRADVWAPCRKGYNKIKHSREIDLKMLDYISVPCPVDGGPVNFIDGKIISALGSRKRGPYKASALRDEFDTYECSSAVYKGNYSLQLEEAEEVDFEPPDEPLFIVGSWSSWKMEEMDNTTDKEYTFSVVLGETRCERFHIVVNEKPEQSIYPILDLGSERTRVYGPDARREGKNWIIDGRNSQVPVGTIYKVTLSWREPLSISIEKTDIIAPDQTVRDHAYYARGTFSSWTSRPMIRLREPPNTYQLQFKIGPSGKEQLHILRDNDESQLIYPNVDAPDRVDVPVRGPDAYGKDKNFVFTGTPGEIIKLKLTVVEAHVVVEMDSSSTVKVWESIEGPGRHDYYLVGNFTEGASVRLEPDAENCNVYRYRGITTENFPYGKMAFCITMDGDEKLAYYPSTPGDTPGKSIVRGPDANGSDVFFSFDFWRHDAEFEITLDLEAIDKRKIVDLKWLTDPIDFDTMKGLVEISMSEMMVEN